VSFGLPLDPFLSQKFSSHLPTPLTNFNYSYMYITRWSHYSNKCICFHPCYSAFKHIYVIIQIGSLLKLWGGSDTIPLANLPCGYLCVHLVPLVQYNVNLEVVWGNTVCRLYVLAGHGYGALNISNLKSYYPTFTTELLDVYRKWSCDMCAKKKS